MVWTWHKAHRTLTVLFAALTCGCAYNDGGVKTTTLSGQVDVSRAFMMPPPGGPGIIAVLENRFVNALAQDMILENNTGLPGQNVLYVRAFGPMGENAGTGELAPDIPKLANIQRELRERFPGVAMQVSGLYAQNRYGPIGYATGRSHSGVNCIYVWQRIAGEPRLFRVERGSITWQLRLCDPNTSVRDLLLIAYGFTVTGYFASKNWNPYGPPPEPDPRIGKTGEIILPETVVDDMVIAPVSFGQPRKRRRARSASSSRTAVGRPAPSPQRPTVLNQPVPGAAVVPRPENTNLGEPAIDRSNLTQTAPRTGGFTVPPPSSDEGALHTTPTAPSTATPSGPSVPRVLLPEGSALETPAVSVVRDS